MPKLHRFENAYYSRSAVKFCGRAINFYINYTAVFTFSWEAARKILVVTSQTEIDPIGKFPPAIGCGKI
ncbi:MAG: hypothetical protein GDA38_26545 [Hormoscilla sp. SP12CHS1]|nr:hypothetical protein [Hormoscilla sp. SP12CHS1]